MNTVVVAEGAPTEAAAEPIAEEAPAKLKRKKGRMLRLRHAPSPEERRWRMWDHDFDALMHGLAQNPAALSLTPEQIVHWAAKTADAMNEEQDKRNPRRFENFRY
jgi:DNA-binding GntR family transcriptional regulator